MNCEQARNLAALAASGDLTVAEQCALELHTDHCAECRSEEDEFAALLSGLLEMRAESAPNHVYAAVRARVAAEITGDRSRRFAAWPAFVAVLACSVVLMVLLRPVATTVVTHPIQHAETDIAVAAVGADSPVPVRTLQANRPIRRHVITAKVEEPSEPLVVQMFTDDPEVVIYWIADAKSKRSEKEIIQ